MSYGKTITYSTAILYIKDLQVREIPGTKKQVVGKNIVRTPIPGLASFEKEISISGTMFDTGTTADVQRTNLLASQDATSHTYTDGVNNGTYYITDLSFNDIDNNTNIYEFSLTFIEDI